MKYFFLSLILAFSVWGQCSATQRFNTDSILNVLDAVIDSTPHYENALQIKINKHRTAYETTSNSSVKFCEATELFNLYRKFHVDSAMHYARELVKQAKAFHSPDTTALAQMYKADAMRRLGRFQEAIELLNSIPHSEFVKQNAFYYNTYHSIYNSLANNAIGDEETGYYKSIRKLYRDTVMMEDHRNGSINSINQAEVLKDEGKYSQALSILLDCQQKFSKDIENDAVYWAVLAEVYKYLNDMEGAKYCYAKSAIIDKQSCNKTYTSLQNLAALLFDEGETDRAYKYITLSMSDVKEAHALSRLSLVGEYLPIITTAYEKKQHIIATRRTILIVVSTVLTIILATLLLLLVKRSHKLHVLQEQLAHNNAQLKKLNNDLELTNKALEESNIIKEVYLGQLFNLCSNYIGQFNNYRTSLVAKLKSGRLKDIEKALAHDTSNAQLKSLFKDFDKVFLEIFPDFVEKFNDMLKPEDKIYPKTGELLTPELRIYALVRLGINDSTKIAEFLHYSVQTVYNYRQRIRNKTNLSSQELVRKVQSL